MKWVALYCVAVFWIWFFVATGHEATRRRDEDKRDE